ncbi:hypothetical protein HD554DRAFT_871076 [Boletus coccyginus]|nr:hypothetical protein HD554DRAFT_871076 [Boletus coccyginus]
MPRTGVTARSSSPQPRIASSPKTHRPRASPGSTMSSPAALVRGPLIGTFLGLVLYGVTFMQAFFYFRTYEHDTRTLKATVALLVVLETVHAAMSMWVMDDYLVVHYADESTLASANWSSTSTYILGLLIDFYVYLYFTWRIWLFTSSTWIVALMYNSSARFSRHVNLCPISAISIVVTIFSVLKPTWNIYLASYRTLLIVGNVLFIVGDSFSASAMAYHLTKFKSRAHAPPAGRPRRIDVLLNRLLIFVVATGALTSCVLSHLFFDRGVLDGGDVSH